MRRTTFACLVACLLAISGGSITAEEDRSPRGGFAPAGTLVEPRLFHTSTLMPDGRVLVIGGLSDELFATVELWDPGAMSFERVGRTAAPRMYHSATLLSDDRVLVIGGGLGDALGTYEVRDPKTGRFGLAGSLSEPRGGHSATLLPDGRILVIGGAGDYDVDWELGSAELWDPADETSRPAGSLAEPRWLGTATLLGDGRVLVIGGSRGAKILGSAELWDPATESFGPAGTLAQARSGHTATLLADGRVLVIGGGSGDRDAPVRAEIWDAATGSFTPAAALDHDRAFHTATPLPNGSVLVVGGWDWRSDDNDVLAPAELWDPLTESFEPAGSLAVPRAAHSATLLGDGRVLVIGGRTARDGVINAAEIWQAAGP